jgi:hypothetical protein
LSVELAWLLCEAANRGIFTGGRFSYHDRHVVKGVLRDRPYPIVTLDTERNHSRQEVRKRELKLIGRDAFEPWELRDFLSLF